MIAPRLNLVVLRVADIERSSSFYGLLGLEFTKHAHGSGPQHYASEMGGFVFELYPSSAEQPVSSSVRIGFCVADVDAAAASLGNFAGAKLVAAPKDSPWGRRAVIADPDNHRIELVTPRTGFIVDWSCAAPKLGVARAVSDRRPMLTSMSVSRVVDGPASRRKFWLVQCFLAHRAGRHRLSSLMPPLSEDEFRLLAFLRGYADHPQQHFCPTSIGKMLEFSETQMRATARGLAAKGLAEVFEWSPSKADLIQHPEIVEGSYMPDIRLSAHGWNYLRPPEA